MTAPLQERPPVAYDAVVGRDKLRAKALKLKDKGKSVRQVAKVLGISKSRAGRLLSECPADRPASRDVSRGTVGQRKPAKKQRRTEMQKAERRVLRAKRVIEDLPTVEELSDMARLAAYEAIDQVIEQIPAAAIRDNVGAAKVCAELSQLLAGKPTAIEGTTAAGDLVDQAIEAADRCGVRLSVVPDMDDEASS